MHSGWNLGWRPETCTLLPLCMPIPCMRTGSLHTSFTLLRWHTHFKSAHGWTIWQGYLNSQMAQYPTCWRNEVDIEIWTSKLMAPTPTAVSWTSTLQQANLHTMPSCVPCNICGRIYQCKIVLETLPDQLSTHPPTQPSASWLEVLLPFQAQVVQELSVTK